jgi:hypothetical protein
MFVVNMSKLFRLHFLFFDISIERLGMLQLNKLFVRIYLLIYALKFITAVNTCDAV